MSQLFGSDPQQIPTLIKRCPDYLLAELILLDRPTEAEKKQYTAGGYDFYNALYIAAIEELQRRQATQQAQSSEDK